MSDNKVDIPEVEAFSDDLQEASSDIRSQLDKVKESIETINSMDSFSGKAAKEAKSYFSELHLTILESFRGLFDDLEENLQQHLNTFESEVDSSDSAVIRSNYLQDVKEEVNDVFADLEKQDESIADTIKDVSDISSATPPSFSDVNEWKKKAIKKLEELDEDLESFTGEGDETDVKAIMDKIETAMDNAKTSEGKARFADFEGASQMKELAKLVDYNEDKQKEQMEKAKDAKESTIKNLDETSSKDVVNKAYQELENGDIGYDQYMTILDSVKSTSENIDRKDLEGESTKDFIEYLEDHDMLDQYVEENLDDKSNFYLKQVKEDYKNKNIDKATYGAIHLGVIQDGPTFIKNAGEARLPNSVPEQVKKDVGQWAKTYNPDAIQKEQKAIEWGDDDEKGRYESPNVWNKNIKINMLKNEQTHSNSKGDTESREKVEEAEKKEMQLREEYSALSDYLIGETEEPHKVDQLTLDNGSTFDYRIDNEGYLHYKAEPGYTYYEETHKRAATDDTQAKLLRSYITSRITGGVGGALNLSEKSSKIFGYVGSGAHDQISNYMNSNKLKNSKWVLPNLLYKPDTGQVKTTVYRTNKKTGKKENLVIDSKGDEILDSRGWREYK